MSNMIWYQLYTNLFVFLSIFCVQIENHPLYLSVTEINYESEEKGMVVILRVFADDMEKALIQQGVPRISLMQEDSLLAHREVIMDYIQERLRVNINQKKYPLILSEMGIDAQAIKMIFIFPVEDRESIKRLKIYNNILTEVYDTQINLIRCYLTSESTFAKLTKQLTETTFKIKN